MLDSWRIADSFSALFSEKGWEVEPNVLDDSDAANAKKDFLKDRIGI